jgi:hypothetical protein
MTERVSPAGRRISRRALLQGAGALGLSAAGGAWPGRGRALALPATNIQSAAQPRPPSAGHLVVDYLPSQPTGWGGVTIGGHVASVPFTFEGDAYEISLLSFGQPGSAPDPVYEPEPSDPTIDFNRTLQQAWGTYYSFRYRGGFGGRSKIVVHSYNVLAREPTTTRLAAASTHPTPAHSPGTSSALSYGGDLFILYEPDSASSDPPANDDLQWIQVVYAQGRSFVDGPPRANPYYFGAGPTSIYGRPVCSFYDRPGTGIGQGAEGTSPITIETQEMFETFLVHDTGRRDRVRRGIIDVYGGVKWGWQIQPAQS